MKENTVFADAFNYLIYGGKAVVDPAQLQELDTTEIALPFGAQDESGNQTDDVAQKYRDVLKSAVIKQVARGYAVMANGGFLVDPWFISKIENDQGGVIFEAKPKVACRNAIFR